MRRIFYFAPFVTDDLNIQYGQNHYVGAATTKIVGICSALRSVGVFPIIVTGMISLQVKRIARFPKHAKAGGACVAVLFSMGHGLVKRMIAAWSFLFYAIRHVGVGDRVILYNYFLEYILAALYLRARGRPAILDIEDAPRLDEGGLRGFGNRILFPIFIFLCAKRYLTVSHQIAKLHNLNQYLAIYGVPRDFERVRNQREKFSGERVHILFGGSIMPETGLNLFREAVSLLAAQCPELPVKFFVTGGFPYQELVSLAREIESSSSILIEVFSNLTAAEYMTLAANMDVGLSLKLPSEGIGQTTFPSKVIEYAGLGLLVCSTEVSDVPRLFDNTTAILLKSESPEELAAAIVECEKNRQQSSLRARAGRDRVLEICARQKVGQNLVDLIYA